MMKLTGRARWRSQRRLFSSEELVLQVEWTGTVPEHMGGYITMEDRTEWRDARSQDLTGDVMQITPIRLAEDRL